MDVCRTEQESQELHAEDDLKYGGCHGYHSYIAECKEVGMKSDNKGDCGFGNIVVGFCSKGRGSGNRLVQVLDCSIDS